MEVNAKETNICTVIKDFNAKLDPTSSISTCSYASSTNFLYALQLQVPAPPGSSSSRGRILGRNWDKSLKCFPPCYSQSQRILLPPPIESKSGLKMVCNVNILYDAQKPQRNFTFMNSASVQIFCRPATSFANSSKPNSKHN